MGDPRDTWARMKAWGDLLASFLRPPHDCGPEGGAMAADRWASEKPVQICLLIANVDGWYGYIKGLSPEAHS